MRYYNFNNIKCKVCENRITVFDCKICNERICNYCCDKIQLGQNTKALSEYRINFDNTIDKCIECKKYIRKENYNIPYEEENGYDCQCYSHTYDGYVFFSGNVYNAYKKLVNFIENKEDKSFSDNYMIAYCYSILDYSIKAYPYINLCIKQINTLKDKDDKVEIYLLHSNICIDVNEKEKALASIEKAILLDNEMSDVYRVKADILRLLKRDRESYNFYNIALEKYYESPELKSNIIYIYLGLATVCSRLNKLDEIIINLDNYIEQINGNEFILDIQTKLNSGMKVNGLSFSMDMILDVYHMYIATYLDLKKYDFARKYLEYALYISPLDLENKKLEGRVVQAEIMDKEISELREKYAQSINSNIDLHLGNSIVVINGGSMNMANVSFNAAVNAGVINNGDNSIVNYYSSEVGEKTNIDNLIDIINKHIDSLELNTKEKSELEEQVLRLKESNISKTSNGKSKEILKSIRNILEGITGSMVATGILAFIGQTLGK